MVGIRSLRENFHRALSLAAVAVMAATCWQTVAAEPASPQPQRVSIWPGRAPIGDGNFEAAEVWITVHRPAPEKANGAAIVICPGGGYGGRVVGPEGHGIAQWLVRHGIAGVVLEYRLPKGRSMVPMLDAQRAIRTVRTNAKSWNIDPSRIGIIGFSAGGHLASTAGTHFDEGDPKAADPMDRASCRPDFVVLVYPVVTLGPKTHGGTKGNLLGPNPSPAMVEKFSAEKQVTPRTPPMFLTHAKDDKAVPPENSRALYEALLAHHVAAEYLELPRGGHGLNGYKGPMWDAWQTGSLAWLATQKFIPQADAARPAEADRAETVRQRLWIWGHPAGVYNGSFLRPLGLKSSIEPVAGAESLGLKNMIFVRYDGKPSAPFDTYYAPFRKLDRVYWSLVAAGGGTSVSERDAAFALAEKNPNLVGFILDDFFHEPSQGNAADPVGSKASPETPFHASLTPAELRTLHQRQVRGQKLPIMGVIYTAQVKPRARAHIAEVDQLCLWTWRPADLKNLEANFTALEKLAPGKQLYLGCYMFDFHQNKPLPVALMQHQVELGYRWLRSGRIAGMIFLATPNVDVGLEAVDWSRQWIRTVGDQVLPAPGK